MCCGPEPAKSTTPCPTALTLATPFEMIYTGLWSYNCVLSCITIGGMFYALTWQTHLLALVCGGYWGKLKIKSLCYSFLPAALDDMEFMVTSNQI